MQYPDWNKKVKNQHPLQMKYTFLFVCLLGIALRSGAEDMKHAPDSLAEATMWSIINANLSAGTTDSTFQIINMVIKGHCEKDFDCMYKSYERVLNHYESNFQMGRAIDVSNIMAQLARDANNEPKLADSYIDLDRYHMALGNELLGIGYIDQAIDIYRKHKLYGKLTRAEVFKVEYSLNYKPVEEVLTDLMRLLQEAEARGDNRSAIFVRRRALEFAIDAEDYDLAEELISKLEEIPISEEVTSSEHSLLITINLNRGLLASAKGNLDAAVSYFEKGIYSAEQAPDYWLRTYLLQHLAEVEIKRENLDIAEAYLELSEKIGTERKMDDLLARTYGVYASFS